VKINIGIMIANMDLILSEVVVKKNTPVVTENVVINQDK
jgi:hypothetical protein